MASCVPILCLRNMTVFSITDPFLVFTLLLSFHVRSYGSTAVEHHRPCRMYETYYVVRSVPSSIDRMGRNTSIGGVLFFADSTCSAYLLTFYRLLRPSTDISTEYKYWMVVQYKTATPADRSESETHRDSKNQKFPRDSRLATTTRCHSPRHIATTIR